MQTRVSPSWPCVAFGRRPPLPSDTRTRLSRTNPTPVYHTMRLRSLPMRSKAIDPGTIPGAASDVMRTSLRLGIPSKGRMAEDTLQLLKDCQLPVFRPNPRQYVAKISQLPGLEVWFQRASDVVRKLKYGDIDLGIVGYDMLNELGGDDSNLIVVHDALGFGHCHLSLGVPITGPYSTVTTFEQLIGMQHAGGNKWTAENPLRVVTGYTNIAKEFFAQKGFEDYVLLGGDGALEAAPAMGSADIILDLVSTGVTLRENNLKEIEGGQVIQSEGVLVARRQSLLGNERLLEITKELIERFDAHLVAEGYYSLVANLKGLSPENVAEKLLQAKSLAGLEGPTIGTVYKTSDDNGAPQQTSGLYAATICVRKKDLYSAVKELRKIGGGGILIQPMTYIFDDESERWAALLDKLGVDKEHLV